MPSARSSGPPSRPAIFGPCTTWGWPGGADLPELPWAETPTHLVAVGLDQDLDLAVTQAVDSLVTHIAARFGLAPIDAYVLASLAADVEVTQAVNRVKGAHARLPWDRLNGDRVGCEGRADDS